MSAIDRQRVGNTIARVEIIDDVDFLRPLTLQDVRELDLRLLSERDLRQAPVLPFRPSLGQASFVFFAEDEAPQILPFSRPALSPEMVEDLGRMLGEALVARFRRDNATASL